MRVSPGALIVVALVSAIVASALPIRRANATGFQFPAGPTIAVGGTTFDATTGQLSVPIATVGAVPNAYGAFQVHLRWDPKVFTFSDATTTWGPFDPATRAFLCGPPHVDPDGGGVLYGCHGIVLCGMPTGECFVGPVIEQSGMLATITLTARHAGCSDLHLVTYAAPDNASEHSGTVTWTAALPITPELNTYIDGVGVARAHGRVPGPACATRAR